MKSSLLPLPPLLTVITQAQPPLDFIPPAFNPFLARSMRPLTPFWRRWVVGISDVQVEHAERLVDLYQQFQSGKVRFLIAFRHPRPTDPFCLEALLWQKVPQIARQKGIPLKDFTHIHFIYDRGIPLWAGQSVGWLFSNLGGTPIRRGGVDLMGLRSARQLFLNGRFPLAAAPEGGTNGHNEIVSPIEPGIAQFGFWCMEDLRKANRSETVLIVPLGIQYSLAGEPWNALERLLIQLEIDCGLGDVDQEIGEDSWKTAFQDNQADLGSQKLTLYRRLFRLGEYLLCQMELFYSKFYNQKLPPSPLESSLPASANEQLAYRLQALLNAALTVAEDYFDLPGKGTVTERCRRLEQAGWDRIYRDDLRQLEALSSVERGLADRVAEEANLRLWHMRLVESFVSVTGRYVFEKPTIDRFAETLLILWETIARIKGRPPQARPQLGHQRVKLVVGTPISVSERYATYQANRRQAVATLTQDLQTTLEAMIQ